GFTKQLKRACGSSMETSSSSPIESRLRHRPVVHFLVLGSLLFAGARAWQTVAPNARRTIVLAKEQLERMRHEWQRETGALVSADAERRLVEHAADKQILLREAFSLGLDRGDRLVRDRLVKLAGFLDLMPEADDDSRERAARDLGLDHSD